MMHNSSRRNIAGNVRWLLVLLIAVCISAYLVWWQSRRMSAPVADPTISASSDKPFGPPMPVSVETASDQTDQVPPQDARKTELELVEDQQLRAAQAAFEAEPVAGPLSKRPEFVSEIEWKVLQDVAERHSEIDQQLTHLVNKLLFFKKRDAWMAQTADPERRRALARDLLAMLPSQVDVRALDPAFAQKMKGELLTCLSQDAH